LADYREHYQEMRATRASVVAISVDKPEKSEALRLEMNLPFPILCDTERRVVKAWDIYNPAEKGGIAKPAVFVVDSNRMVRYSAVDTVATRVPASEIVRVLQTMAEPQPVRRRVHIPRWDQWFRAIRNSIRR
jgi:peroxiredoxin